MEAISYIIMIDMSHVCISPTTYIQLYIQQVTIVPRSKGSLGFAQYLPKEVSLRTSTQIMDIVCMALAGRAAEQVHFGGYTTGASDDLNKVTKIIYEMVQVSRNNY